MGFVVHKLAVGQVCSNSQYISKVLFLDVFSACYVPFMECSFLNFIFEFPCIISL